MIIQEILVNFDKIYEFFNRINFLGFSLWLRNEEIIDESKVGTIPGKSQIKHEMVINYNSTPFTLIMAEIEMK